MKSSAILENISRYLKHWLDKGNEIMDNVPLLRSKRNKTVAWICLAFVSLVAIYRICGGSDGGTAVQNAKYNFDVAPHGADTPEAIVMQYYKAYKDGDPIAFLNCVNFTDEEKRCIIDPLSEKMKVANWRKIANCAYAKIKYECEQRYPYDKAVGCEWATANAYVEASGDWNGSTKYVGRLWNMKKIGGKWFIDKKGSDTGALWMGLTDLSNPDPTQPSN